MPVKWKTTRIGDVRIAHAEHIDPHQLLQTLRGNPLEVRRAGRNALKFYTHVERFKLGNNEIAVRVQPADWPSEHPLEQKLPLLMKSVGRKTAVVEVPLAVVRFPKETALVTLWKKGARPFLEFVEDAAVSSEEKVEAALGAVRALARLHAAGLEHQHAPRNIIVQKGKGVLVDYGLMVNMRETRGYFDKRHLFDLLSHYLTGAVSAKDYWKFKERAETAYERAYRVHRARLIRLGVIKPEAKE